MWVTSEAGSAYTGSLVRRAAAEAPSGAARDAPHRQGLRRRVTAAAEAQERVARDTPTTWAPNAVHASDLILQQSYRAAVAQHPQPGHGPWNEGRRIDDSGQ